MASKKAVLLRIAEAMSAGAIDHVPEWFTEGFKLHDPSFGGFRSGHEGARDMLRSLAEHVPSARIDALDMVEEQIRVLRRRIDEPVKQQCCPKIGDDVRVTAVVGDVVRLDPGADRTVKSISKQPEGPVADLDRPHERYCVQIRQ